MATEHLPSSVSPWGPVPPAKLVPIRSHARRAGEDDHTTVRPLLRPIAAWRMDCSRFGFDSSFITPHARHELPELLRLHRHHPDAPLSVFGHADPTGNDDYNKQLSGRRALAVYGLLVRDVDLWERLYTSPMAGDRWGEQSVQLVLATLTDVDGNPYYEGNIDDQFGSASKDALEHYQTENVDIDGAPLEPDGILGPKSRKSMFRRYMDHLCTDDHDGDTLQLEDAHFLARGADPEHRGDVQGCSELNPLMVFSQEEHAKFQSFANKEERDEENSVNRRVVVFLYPDRVQVNPEHWPCPAAEGGVAKCRARFWSDHDVRRNPQATRRHFDGDFDTFACRFYHYFGNNTPAETPIHLGLTFDVYLHREVGHPTPTGTYRMVSEDGTVDETIPAAAAVLLRVDARGEVRGLSFTGLRAANTYTLSFLPEGGGDAFEPVVLARKIRLSDFTTLGQGKSTDDETEEVAYVKSEDDGYLAYEPDPDTGSIDWDAFDEEDGRA